jgi:hypothetical protein
MARTRRSVGPLLVVEHFLRELAVKDTVDGAPARSARSVLSVGEVVCALLRESPVLPVAAL